MERQKAYLISISVFGGEYLPDVVFVGTHAKERAEKYYNEQPTDAHTKYKLWPVYIAE
jgi:hypothetical protein